MTSVDTFHIAEDSVCEQGVRVFWRHRQLIRRHRATRTTMVILATFVLLYFPYMLSRLLRVIGLPFSSLMWLVTSSLGIAGFAVNAFIYAIVNHEFQRAFRRILLCRVAALNSVAAEHS